MIGWHRAPARPRWHGPLAVTRAALFGLLLLPAAAGATPSLSLVWMATTGSGTTGGSTIDAKPGDTLTLDVQVTPDSAGISLASLSLSFDSGVLAATSTVECPSPPNPIAGSCGSASPFLTPMTTGAGSGASSSVGDFDSDGSVGAADFALFLAEFGMTVPPGNPMFDLNGDLLINPPDFILFLMNYGYPGNAGIFSDRVEILEAATVAAPPVQTNTFTLARLTFDVKGVGTSPVDVFYLPKVDGVVDGSATLLADSASPSGVTVTNASVTSRGRLPSLGAAGLLALALTLALGALRRVPRG